MFEDLPQIAATGGKIELEIMFTAIEVEVVLLFFVLFFVFLSSSHYGSKIQKLCAMHKALVCYFVL